LDPSASKRNPGKENAPAQAVLGAAKSAIASLQTSLDSSALSSWLEALDGSKGRLVLSGIGKSGLVAQKISATFASTGRPSFYLHPADALHGDLGMVTEDDIALLLSNSGESEEILRLLPPLIRAGVPIACITSNKESSLAQASKWVFAYDLPEGEGCPLNFAPMASTTMQMILGDALAAERMVSSGFTLDSFAKNHPGGSLGTKLLKANELMHSTFPMVSPDSTLIEILATMTAGKLGMATVMESERLAGVISDGDIRRALERAESEGQNPLKLKAVQIMTAKPTTIQPDIQAIEAAKIMETKKITFLVVVEGDRPIGLLHIHDLLTAKVI